MLWRAIGIKLSGFSDEIELTQSRGSAIRLKTHGRTCKQPKCTMAAFTAWSSQRSSKNREGLTGFRLTTTQYIVPAHIIKGISFRRIINIRHQPCNNAKNTLHTRLCCNALRMLLVHLQPAANGLRSLNIFPNNHRSTGAGRPIPIAMNPSKLFPHP